jgi:quercetin dioxygenase-like cupin family protein
MIAMQLNELNLMDGWQEHDPALRWKVQFPLMGMPGTASLGSVYFELEPGQVLPSHTDSRDEIVILLSGSGEGTVGNETSHLSAGGMVFIPAMEPHGFRNTGSETVRAIGIFAGAAVVSTFEHEVMPMGIRVFDATAVPSED